MDTWTPRSHPHLQWSAETPLGRWTTRLAMLALGGIVALMLAFALGMENAERFSDKPLLTLAASAVVVSSLASVVTGAVALVRHHDHTWAVVSATTVGILLSVVGLQQVAEGLGWLSA